MTQTTMMPSVGLHIAGADVLHEYVPILSSGLLLGRASDSTIQLMHGTVSRRHAEIRTGSFGLQIRDLGSANGTKINKIELPVKFWHALAVGDILEIGPFTITVKEGTGAQAPAKEVASNATLVVSPAIVPVLRVTMPDGGSREFTLTGASHSLGRSPDNDIVIDDQRVSRRHARLEKRDGRYEILDLQSTNGLTFDNQRIEKKLLSPGDILSIGESIKIELCSTRLLPPETRATAPIDLESSETVVLGRGGPLGAGEVVRADGRTLQLAGDQLRPGKEDEIALDAVGLRRVVSSGAMILQDISLSMRSGEFVTIVGPAGCGKSTLLRALCGYEPATSGKVLLNGTDCYTHIEAFRNQVGFVRQDDTINPELSIREAITYAARVRMPSDTTDLDIRHRIDEVLEELALTALAETPVGEISGGQRQRVAIGVELLTRPSLLFLDGATTGLDPDAELQTMKLFRHLADNNRIIVLATRASRNILICDKVALLAKGGYLAFFGPPEDALGYFGVKDFDEIYPLLESKSGQAWAGQFNALGVSTTLQN